MKELILYYFEECPFCKKVKKFLEGKAIDITYKNIHTDKEAYNTLIKIGGKSQVPCLFINGKPLYESDAIITWLKNNA